MKGRRKINAVFALKEKSPAEAALAIPSNKFRKYLLPVFICAGLIFLASCVPGNKVPGLFFFQDIVYHLFIYAVFGWLVIRSLKGYYPNIKTLNSLFLSVLIGFIYALSDEYHQLYVPYRNASMVDVAVDVLGVFAGSMLFINRTKKRSNG